MTVRGAFTLLQRLLVGVVLAGSGGYLIVYLYRWEWNRALISGVVFVAAEVALATSMLSTRFDRSIRSNGSFDLAVARLREARIDRRNPFRWLPPPDRLGVFVPVLLGAGVVLSALAYIVERVAETTAHLTVDRRLARRLALLAPVHARPRSGTSAPRALQWTGSPRRAGPIAGVVAAGVIAALTIQVLAEATQSRVDDSERPARTTIVLAVDHRTSSSKLDTAGALWVACQPTLPSRLRSAGTIREVGGNVSLELVPGIRALETRRLTGCLADFTLRWVRADVLDVRHVPND